MADIVGILLAAGASTRFGRPKLLEPLPDGRTLAAAAARTLVAVLPQSIAVVRPEDRELDTLLRGLGLRTVVNTNADDGMGGSLALGVRTCPAAGWVIALADMPRIQPSTVRLVVEALAAGAPIAAPRYAGRRGHPVGFSARFGTELTALNGDQGAKSILDRHAAELALIDVDDPGVLVDIDRPADLLL